MKTRKFKALFMEVGEEPKFIEVVDKLENLQALVDGFIESVYLGENLVVICNEEGKLNGMQGNRRIGNDVIAGPFFIVGEDGDEFRSLTDEEVKESLKRFAEPEEISQEEVENALSAGIMFFG